jgi:hypothetical protein
MTVDTIFWKWLPLTTFNVVFTGGIALVVLGVNLWYDRLKRRQDREAALRRDVFLLALDGVGAYETFLLSLLDTVDSGRQEFPSDSWVLKLHAVGSMKSIESIEHLRRSMAEATATVMTMRATIQHSDFEIKIIRENQRQLRDVYVRLSTGSPTADSVESCRRTWERIAALEDRLEVVTKASNHQQSELARYVMASMGSVSTAVSSVVQELRIELGIKKVNQKRYRQLLSEGSRHQTEALERIYSAYQPSVLSGDTPADSGREG